MFGVMSSWTPRKNVLSSEGETLIGLVKFDCLQELAERRQLFLNGFLVAG